MQLPDYNLTKGTVWGETRNEVFCKYGEESYSTFMYSWTVVHTSETTYNIYNLVNTIYGIKFLITSVETSQFNPLIPVPPPIIKIEFLWKDAGIPFLTQKELEEQNIPYTL